MGFRRWSETHQPSENDNEVDVARLDSLAHADLGNEITVTTPPEGPRAPAMRPWGGQYVLGSKLILEGRRAEPPDSGMKCGGGADNGFSGRAAGSGMRNLRRILIVDDDAALRQSLAEQLELHAEFASLECDCAAAAIRIIGQEQFDAVLLDVGLPDMNGHELCREMRRVGITVPIVMLTAADSGSWTRYSDLVPAPMITWTKPFRLSDALQRHRELHLQQSELNGRCGADDRAYTFRPSAKLMTVADGKRKVRLHREGSRDPPNSSIAQAG